MAVNKTQLTGIAGLVSALLFASIFAIYNTNRTDDSTATSTVQCNADNQIRIFLSDIPKYASRDARVLLDDKSPSNLSRTFDLPVKIPAGKYDVHVISSDTHHNHRSNEPGLDVQNQPNEEFYVSIDGARTANHSTDFTDYYDWRGGEGEQLQDDDKNIDTVPNEVREIWQGEPLGTIDVAKDTARIMIEHSDVYDDFKARYNSVVPSAIILGCHEPSEPVLEVEKSVDANGDNQFDPLVESAQPGTNVTWRVTGRNVGEAIDSAATLTSCAPEGTTYVPNSARVIGGTGDGLLEQSANCFGWTGELAQGESVDITFDVVMNDFVACDVADGDVDGHCTCDAVIYSNATLSSADDPADRDIAMATQLQPGLGIEKRVDGSDEDTLLSDDEEKITPDGSTITWEITATNDGPGNAPKARVVDTYPGGVSLVEAEATAGQVSIGGDQLIWDGSLDVNDQVVITVESTINDVNAYNACETADVPGNQPGDGLCTNRAFIGQAGDSTDDFAGATVHDDAEVYAVLQPNLTIKKYVDGIDEGVVFSDDQPEEIKPGVDFPWRVAGCNVGNVIQINARVVDVIPAGVQLRDTADAIRVNGTAGNSAISITTIPGTNDQAIVWNGSLDAGDCVELEYTAQVSDEASYRACVAATMASEEVCGVDAYIGEATNESNVSVDLLTRSSDPAYVMADFESILQIEKQVDADQATAFDPVIEQAQLGQNIRWLIRATNTGTGDEPMARIIDAIPADMELASVTAASIGSTVEGGASGTVSISDGVIIWDGSMPAGSSVELTFQTKLNNMAKYNSCAAVTSGEFCRNIAQIGTQKVNSTTGLIGQIDTDSADVYIEPVGELSVTKEVDVHNDGSWSELETVTFDQWFDWRIVVSNQSNTAVTDPAMLDVFPEGVIASEVTTQPDIGSTELTVGEERTRVFWTADTLAVGESVEFVVRAKIADLDAFKLCDAGSVDGEADGLCTNRSYVGTGTTPASFDDTDTDHAQVDVLLTPEFYITKVVEGSDDNDEASDFEAVAFDLNEFEWLVTFGNRGNATAEDVTVTDPIPDGVNYVSNEVTGDVGEAVYEPDTRRVVWSGTLEPGQEVRMIIRNAIATEVDFERCDLASGADDSTCINTTRLTHQDVAIEDPAAVLGSLSAPNMEITKTVDANSDSAFGEVEEVSVDGASITWRVEVSNSGDAAVSNLIMLDDIVDGLSYVADSLVEVEGASYGVTSYNDGSIEWLGSLEAGKKVTIEYKTLLSSTVGFGTCNFSDGNAQDSQCTNTAQLMFNSDSASPIAEDTASITTSLPSLLAYTGSSGTTSVLVGVAVVVATLLLTAAVYLSSRPGRGSGGAGPNLPANLHPPSHIIYPHS